MGDAVMAIMECLSIVNNEAVDTRYVSLIGRIDGLDFTNNEAKLKKLLINASADIVIQVLFLIITEAHGRSSSASSIFSL